MLSQADTFRVRIRIAKLKINFRSVIIFMIFFDTVCHLDSAALALLRAVRARWNSRALRRCSL